MARRSYRPEQIINKLRKAEVLLSQGSSVGKAARKIRITDETYYRWRREYGAIRIGEVRRPKELELAKLIFLQNIGKYFSTQDVQILSLTALQTLVQLAGRSERPFWVGCYERVGPPPELAKTQMEDLIVVFI